MHHAIQRRLTAAWRPPEDFWTSFHESHWERSPTVLRRPFGEAVTTPARLWDAMVEASDRYRYRDPAVRLELYVEHAMLVADVGRHLPTPSDPSIEGWVERLRRMIGGRRFGLVVTDVQFHEPALWLRLRDILRGLFARTGLPSAAKATLFLGDYPATPFGLHRGNSGALAFVVQGPKRVRTWPDAYFRERPDLTGRLDYHAHDGDATVLDGDAGDVLYWPSDHWHVGEAVDGSLSCSVHVHAYMGSDREGELLARAVPLLRRRVRALGPDASDEALAAALAESAADPALPRELRVARLRHASALGFAHPPAPRQPEPLADGAIVRGSREFPILWTDFDAERLAVVANGHAFGLTRGALVIALLERLNAGEAERVDDLVARFAGASDGVDTSPEAVRAVLERLVSLRALSVDPVPLAGIR